MLGQLMCLFSARLSTHSCAMNPSHRWITLTAGLLGFLGVALGAFGAHALKATLLANGQLDSWKTAVLYQLIHAVALLALANGRDSLGGPNTKVAACWVTGVLLFSGSLYGLALGGPISLLWPITPLGGLALLAGWGLLVLTAWKRPKA
jgi:uncharacterized membrane protein YgdD (TMEM256/DUF423 family)